MNKMLVLLVIAQIAQANATTPTEFIMQFLKRSGTVWRGSLEWKDSLDSLENGSQIHTNYAATHLKEYVGVVARVFQLNETGVKSSFGVTKKEGCIEVDSTIECREERVVTADTDLQLLKATVKRHPSKKIEEDNCTKCEYLAKMNFDEASRKLSVVLTAHCKSKIPNSLFNHELKEQV